MPLPRLRLWKILLSILLVLSLALSYSDVASSYVVSCLMERPTWQGTEAGHWPMVREKLIPDNNNVGELGNSCPLSVPALRWLQPNLTLCSLWEPLSWVTWLSGAWIWDPQKLWDNKFCFKILGVGVNFYAVIDNSFSKRPKTCWRWHLSEIRLLITTVKKLVKLGCNMESFPVRLQTFLIVPIPLVVGICHKLLSLTSYAL